MLLMAMIVLTFWFWFCTDYITTVLIKWSQSINENHNLSCQGETKAKDVFFNHRHIYENTQSIVREH